MFLFFLSEKTYSGSPLRWTVCIWYFLRCHNTFYDRR